MQEKFLREVIGIIVGKQEEEIVNLLDSKKHVNEFIIAKKLEITINQTRNILYKISDQGLVSSERKKDKKKGWYTYFWRLEILKSLEFLKLHLLKQIEQIKNQIKSRESKKFYVCERCNIEISEENALLHDFTCNECGDIFTLKDNTKLLREFNMNLKRLESKLELLNLEVDKEQEKIDKVKEKGLKKIAKEKEDLRKEKAALRKAAKKKVAKKVVKKVVKKKVAGSRTKSVVSSSKNRERKKKVSAKKKVAKKK
jgi:transcription factor E